MGSNWNGANISQRPAFALTVSERAALLNWACFDVLSAALSPSLLQGDRYVNSLEFQPDDQFPIYQRMQKVLEDIPTGDPLALPIEQRKEMHVLLDESWFSEKLSEHVSRWGTPQMYCYQRARYLFISHGLHLGPENLHKVLTQASDYGLNHRYALTGVGFDGSRGDADVHQPE